MCRYVAYLGGPLYLRDLVYEPANSLINQASDALESRTRINADGFGLGWYCRDHGAKPAVFKEITPAWSNANLHSLADCISSKCIVAHVRAATGRDPVSRSNCHPFRHGPLLWMHNGDIPGRGRLFRNVVSAADDDLVARIRGNTDSELAFVLFCTRLPSRVGLTFSPDELVVAMEKTIRKIAEWQAKAGDRRPLALNFCVTNGRSLVATRFARGDVTPPTLHYCTGGRFVCENGMCRVEERSHDSRCVIIASERLSEDPRWVTVERDSVVVVGEDLGVRVKKLEVAEG
ncbi:MAG: class II glutamine amidotransferase [Acidobacteria bacterium]|nr:class II glutamine amidotransferase [Acidobacteriota bacterium]NIQ30660.1 class II glutamine amidotransferase [Acidobacteriota bacterium]NIQ85618.1 class II glutamine amidotransferase [Acidobacteriota bacterium]